MPRRAFITSYRGTGFPGWQTQTSGQAIQDLIEKALATIAQHECPIVCAGRTDAGVHALKQVFHADLQASRPDSAWLRGVNAHLPPSVAMVASFEVSPHFHARFNANTRTYRYVIERSPIKNPLSVGRVGWVFRPLHVGVMCQAAALLIGEHDFSSFRSSQCQSKSPVRTIFDIRFEERGERIALQITANAFLHHMIRNIVGALVEVGTERRDIDWFITMFDAKDRRLGAPTFSADGLYFVGVGYSLEHASADFVSAAAPLLLSDAQW